MKTTIALVLIVSSVLLTGCGSSTAENSSASTSPAASPAAGGPTATHAAAGER